MTRKNISLPVYLALIVVLGFAVYANSLKGEFVWDDNYLVKNNAYIKNYSHTGKLFTENIAAGAHRKWNAYRPLPMISYLLDYSCWGLNPTGYHLTNLLLHILAALALYWLINILSGRRLLSLFTAAFFVSHPVHTEAVTYISGRADPLALLFMLLCFCLYLKLLRRKTTAAFILTLLSYVLALLSRESGLILPVLILLYHYAFRKKVEPGYFLPLLGLACVYAFLRVTALRPMLFNIVYSTTMSQRIPGFFVAFLNYLRLMLLPFPLHMEYGDRLFAFSDPRVIAGISLISGLAIFAFWKGKSNRLIFFSVFWFILALLPSSNLYPINAYMAEHWLYLPSVGFFLLLAEGLSYCLQKEKLRSAGIVAALVLLIFYSFLTIGQNRYWKDPVTLYEMTLKYVPDSKRTLNSLGMTYHASGRREEAISLFQRALEVDPDFVDAHNNLGVVYRDMGRKQEAIALFEAAIEIKPDAAEIHYNLGVSNYDLGRYDKAIASFRKALELIPDFPEAHVNLGVIYHDTGRKEEAIASYRKAIEINPDLQMAYYNLGGIYAETGRYQDAIATYRRLINITSGNAEIYYYLGTLYDYTGKGGEAIAAYRMATVADPDYAEAYNNLAVGYYRQKQYKLAIEHADQAVRLGYQVNPEFLKLLEPYRKGER